MANTFLPATYQQNYGYSGVGPQMYPQYQQSMAQMQAPQQMQQSGMGLKWVDGEIGAKAFQMPQGWPANQPIALWDTNDTVIYLKSINPMGMPNPLQKAHYTLEGAGQGERMKAQSGDTEEEHDMSMYATKDDLDRMKQELIDAIGQMSSAAPGGRRANTKGD